MTVPPDLAEFLAAHVHNNIRDIEGCLLRLLSFSRLHKVPVTISLAEDAVKALYTAGPHATPPPTIILQTVADYFRLPSSALTGTSRVQHITEARHIAIYLLREDYKLPLQQIGRHMGHRDHSTIIHAYQKISRRQASDPNLKHTLTDIRASLRPH
jgi:chromosomal replication initiator protein